MDQSKKSPQVAGTTSENKRIECKRCGSSNEKIDNYCRNCGKPNNLKTIERVRDFKLSLISLLIALVAIIVTLSN